MLTTALVAVLLLTALNVLIFHVTTTNERNNIKQSPEIETETIEEDVSIPSLETNFRAGYKEIWKDLSSLEEEIASLVTQHKTIIKTDKESTVIGFALGSSLTTIKQFIGSLRRTGYQGHIILGIKESDIQNANIKKYLESQNVAIKVITFYTCTHPYPEEEYWEVNACPKEYPMLKIRWGRFPLAHDWLMQCDTCTGPVLFTDTYDVLFQENPFSPDRISSINALQVFEEHSSRRTTNWFVDYYMNECKGVQFDEPMLCSGTIIGRRDDMLMYLSTMTNEMMEWMKVNKCRHPAQGDDQAIHNYLYYTHKLKNTKAIPYRTGIASVVGSDASNFREDYKNRLKRLDIEDSKIESTPYDGANEHTWIGAKFGYTDGEGYFLNKDGSRTAVVHQFDRFGPEATSFYVKRYT